MEYTINAEIDLSKEYLNETDEVRSVLQCVKNILRTRKGTVPMYREFGIPHTFLDQPIPRVKPILYAEIYNAIQQYEPRATVLSLDFKPSDEEHGKMIPLVRIEVG